MEVTSPVEKGANALGMNGRVREAQNSPTHPNVHFTLWCLIAYKDNLNSTLNTQILFPSDFHNLVLESIILLTAY